MTRAVGLLVVTGCFNPTYNNPACGPAGECPNGLTCNAGTCFTNSDAGGNDAAAMIDTFVIDAPAACLSWNPHFFSPCLIGSPNGPVSLTAAGTYIYNTTAGTLVDPSNAMIAHATFTVDQTGAPAWGMNVSSFVVAAGATLRVIGAEPLIIASWGSIEIDGTIDAGSSTPAAPQPPISGAGANPTTLCGSSIGHNGQDATNQPGSAGGGGGAFAGAGGVGGVGDQNLQGGTPGSPSSTPHVVRGGCSAGNSGRAGSTAQNPSAISNGGAGGGAIQLTARTSLTIKGTISAGGGGGVGAIQSSADGGGGGGSGGFVGLEGGTLVLQSGVLAANGGGGGGGDGLVAAMEATNGEDGQPSTVAAQGGKPPNGSECATMIGGNGSATTQLGGLGMSGTNIKPCGGSGGGGGAGYILLFSTQITPVATMQSPTGLVNPF